ncbi:MAG: hypothetical protein ACT4PV_12745 [Planctomycetaceae bacterium]
MNPRWWRLGVVVERDGAPWTMTMHARALSEAGARRLVAARLGGERHAVFVCHESEPLPKLPREEDLAALFGPYRRSWEDPGVAPLRRLLEGERGK